MLISESRTLREYWHPVAFAEDVDEGPVGRVLFGTELALWRGPGNRIVATADRCPHRKARLSDGWAERGNIICPYHGWEFDIRGACVAIPQNAPGQRPNPRALVETFPVRESLGLVWVSLSQTPIGDVPDVSVSGDPGWRAIREFDVEWNCSAPHLLDNNLDYSHPAFVHLGTFGNRDQPRVGVGILERTGYGLLGTARIPVVGRPGEEDRETERITTAHVHAPFSGIFHMTYPDGVEHILVKAITPIDDRRCRLQQISLRNDSEEDRPAADIIAFDTAVAVEDRRIMETMPEDFPLGTDELVHIATDKLSVGYRRLLADIIDGAWVPTTDATIEIRQMERVP